MRSFFQSEKHSSTTLTGFIFLFLLLSGTLSAQVTVGFQGGEPGDTWGYTSTGASALAISEATQTPNKVTGTKSLVVGGNDGGGNCFASGTGNGPNTPHTFTFNSLDISASNASTRTLTLNWGNRFPACSGTGWDSGENLTFRAYHDGVAQSTVTLATGSNNAQFSIQSNTYTWTIPPCVSQFYFVISVTTNRADELLFIDNVKMTAPQLNGSLVTSPISGNTTVCFGATENYSVTPETGISYTWSGLPGGASFTTTNGTTASSTIGVNWGIAPPGTYTLTVTPTNSCGNVGTPQTITIIVLPTPPSVTISGPTTMCSGDVITLTSNYPIGNVWSPGGQTTSSVTVNAPGTYSVSVVTPCGTVSAFHTVTLSPVPNATVTSTPISCNGSNDGTLTIVSTDPNLEYSLDGITWQTGNVFSNLAPGTYTPHVRFAGGCSTTIPAVSFTNPATVTASASNSGIYCADSVITLQGSTNISGTTTYSWTGPNGFTSTLQNPTVLAQAGTGTYTLIVTVNGCQSAPATTTVTANPNPVVSVSNTGPYCTGDAIALNSSTSSTGTINYSWSGPGGYTSSAQNPSDATVAGTYQLIITVNGCQSTPATTTVVINPIPDATASYVSPYCAGTPLQLNGATTSTGTVNYSWNGPNGYASTIQNPSDANADGAYTLIVTESGCSSLPATVTVVSQTVNAAATNSGPYCSGDVVSLHASTTSVGTPTYSWTGPNGFTSALQDPTDAAPAGTNTYTLIVSIGGCQSSPVTTIVTVNLNPVANASNGGPYCSGTPILLSGSTTSTGTITYSWSGPNSYSSSAQNPSDATAAGTYQLVISANGCQSVASTTTVIINPVPDATASYVSPYCNGMPLQLNGSSTAPGILNYTWSGPNGYTSTAQNPSDASTAGTYTLIVSSSGCQSSPATVTVVSQMPALSASNTGPYCPGTPIQLYGSTSGSSINYSWSGPNGYTSTAQNPTDATEAGTYTLTITTGSCSNSASTVVSINSNPTAAFSASSPCMNDSVAFQSMCSAPSPEYIASWFWDFNDGTTSTAQNPKHLFDNSGVHPVLLKVTTASGCAASITQDILVQPEIRANFMFSPATISALDPTVHFVNSSINADTYSWNFDYQNSQSTEVSPDFTYPTEPGSYTVKLIAYNANGCMDSISKIVTLEDDLIYYVPNAFTPDGDEFNQTFKPVFTSGFDAANYTLLVFNRWGETIFESHDTDFGWDGTYHGEVIPEGTYTWNIKIKKLHTDAYETSTGHLSLIR